MSPRRRAMSATSGSTNSIVLDLAKPGSREPVRGCDISGGGLSRPAPETPGECIFHSSGLVKALAKAASAPA